MKLRGILFITTVIIYIFGIGAMFVIGLKLMPEGTSAVVAFLWLIVVIVLGICGGILISLPGAPAKLWPAVAVDEIVQVRMAALNEDSKNCKMSRWLLLVQIGDDPHNIRFISTSADCEDLKPGFFYRYDGRGLKSIMKESRPIQAVT